jgi:hypothetical protein
MFHQQIALPLGNLPLNIVYISNGTIGFQKTSNFNTIIDNSGPVTIILSNDNILVGEEELCYNTAINYKELPDLSLWLKNQNLVSPF